jgi:PncC family amidohydrolase
MTGAIREGELTNEGLHFFQDDLDAEAIHFDENLDRDVSSLLKKSTLTLSVAESLTGGMIGERLTRMAGSSAFFLGGVICYHPKTKVSLLGVSPSVIRDSGVVSKEVALAMAEGCKKRFYTDICISTTGAAGPATEAYPADKIGEVHIGFAFKSDSRVKSFRFEGNRDHIRRKTTQAALGFLKYWLVKQAF